MENNPLKKSKYSYECHYIMKDININANLLHDNLSCEYVSIHSQEIHKKLFKTIYITHMQKKYKS